MNPGCIRNQPGHDDEPSGDACYGLEGDVKVAEGWVDDVLPNQVNIDINQMPVRTWHWSYMIGTRIKTVIGLKNPTTPLA